MKKISFRKVDFYDGLGSVTAPLAGLADAQCNSESVLALECYDPLLFPGYSSAARLWLAGVKAPMNVADYKPFAKAFGEPVRTVDGRSVIVNMDAVVVEISRDDGVECVFPCRMRNPVFERVE